MTTELSRDKSSRAQRVSRGCSSGPDVGSPELKRLRVGISCGAALLFLAADASAAGWFLRADASLGRGDQELKTPRGAIDFDDIAVAKLSAGAGFLFASNVAASLDVGWSERGGAEVHTSVFHPDGRERTEYDRGYFDVSGTLSYRLQSGPIATGIGLSPRVSILLTEPEIGYAPLRTQVVPGLDPSVFVAYKRVYLVGRYVLDLGPSYKSVGEGAVTMRDKGFFLGVGIELPI